MDNHHLSRSHKAIIYFSRFVFRFLFKVDAQGLEHTPLEGPLLLAANHYSIYEGPLILAIVPRQPIAPLAKMEYKDTIFGKFLFDPINSIFVSRGEADRKALREIIKRLKNNEAFGISPEGTRSRTGNLIKAKEGTAYIALKTNAWVMPVAVWGPKNIAYDLMCLRRPRMYLRAGKPFKLERDPSKSRNENMAIGTERIMHAIARLLPAKYRGYYADAVQGEPEWEKKANGKSDTFLTES